MSSHVDEKASKGVWALPVLRAFAPPAEPVERDVDDAAGEILPWSTNGTQLRVKAGPARRGFYAPSLDGAPTTTRQAEILNTALIGPPTGTKGVVNGRDVLSRTTISHDPVTAYNSVPREVSSPNVIAMGDVGAGKSAHIKCNYVLRPLLLAGRRAVVFDKKDQAGEGEYSNVVRHYGFEPIRFTTDRTGTTLNLLDPMIVRGTGIQGQARLLNIVTRLARGDQAAHRMGRRSGPRRAPDDARPCRRPRTGPDRRSPEPREHRRRPRIRRTVARQRRTTFTGPACR